MKTFKEFFEATDGRQAEIDRYQQAGQKFSQSMPETTAKIEQAKNELRTAANNLERYAQQGSAGKIDDSQVSSLAERVKNWRQKVSEMARPLNYYSTHKEFLNSIFSIDEMLEKVKYYLQSPPYFRQTTDNKANADHIYRVYLMENGVARMADAIKRLLGES